METRKEIAADKKRCGSHNCTQAVLCTYHDFAGMEEETIKNVNLERLKTHPMVDAQKEAKKIEQSESKEVLGMLMEEGKDHVDDQIEKEKEEAKKAKEKKEKIKVSYD